jgi:hypothetical protein
MRTIAAGEDALTVLRSRPTLAIEAATVGATRADPAPYYLSAIGCYIYACDTALHIAAAGYKTDVVEELLRLGAHARARNRRGAEPLHYAAAGQPGGPHWDPVAQVSTIRRLLAAGADPNAANDDGTTPLHRAVRTRCADAVGALLDGGADPHRKTKRGSTAFDLARMSTGRGGSGWPEAKAEQARILELLGAAV